MKENVFTEDSNTKSSSSNSTVVIGHNRRRSSKRLQAALLDQKVQDDNDNTIGCRQLKACTLSDITNVDHLKGSRVSAQRAFKRRRYCTTRSVTTAVNSSVTSTVNFTQESVDEVFRNLQYREVMMMTPSKNSKQRSVVVNWLISVHDELEVSSETLFLAVSLFDRYLVNNRGEDNNPMIVAFAALHIAAKYEEVYPPELETVMKYRTESGNSTTVEEIISMEKKILVALKFKLGISSVNVFLSMLLCSRRWQNTPHDNDAASIAAYYSYRVLAEPSILVLGKPSLLAAGCLYVATLESTHSSKVNNAWTLKDEKLSGYSRDIVSNIASKMQRVLKATSVPHAIAKRFSKKSNGNLFV